MTMTYDTATPRPGFGMDFILDQIRQLLNKPQMRKAEKRDLRSLGYLGDHLIHDIGFHPSDIRKSDPFLSARHLGAF